MKVKQMRRLRGKAEFNYIRDVNILPTYDLQGTVVTVTTFTLFKRVPFTCRTRVQGCFY